MTRLRVSLFTRILLWFFLNLAVLGGVLYVLFHLQFNLPPDSPLYPGPRFDFVSGRISDEFRQVPTSERTAVLERYSSTYGVEFLLFSDTGQQIGGPTATLPSDVSAYVHGGPQNRPPDGPPPQPPDAGPGLNRGPGARRPDWQGGQPDDGRGGPRGGPPPRMRGWNGRPFSPVSQPMFTLRTTNPTKYWAGVRLPVIESGERRPTMVTLLAASDTIHGNGLFFDVRPWLFVVVVVLVLSILLWMPFVRSLTGTIRQMTAAASQIAEERFDVRVNAQRTDELGQLGASIDQLAMRLEQFVGGQRRFLGDISHELNSPLARLQFALSILEDRVGEQNVAYVADAQEEVRVMADLVSQLLSYAKAGIKTKTVTLVPVALRRTAEDVAGREAANRNVQIEISDELTVEAQPELLARAIANVVRNAVRYAGDAGPIVMAAVPSGDRVELRISDNGPGVPHDVLGRLFDPLFRVEADRGRSTGGTGLGLAIVKTCVEACGGTVSAHNRTPTGFEIRMGLKKAGS